MEKAKNDWMNEKEKRSIEDKLIKKIEFEELNILKHIMRKCSLKKTQILFDGIKLQVQRD